jgi:hypothetical protein
MATKYLPLLLLSSLVIAEPHLMVDSPNIGFTNYDWKRQALVQGWALVEDNCPDGTATCGKRSCCPIGSYCDATEDTNSNLCCPTCTSIPLPNNKLKFMREEQEGKRNKSGILLMI